MRKLTETTSFKVGVKTAGDTDWVFNALRFSTQEKAEKYGNDLASRWTAVRDWQVIPSNDPVKESIQMMEKHFIFEDDQDNLALHQKSIPFDVFLNGKLIDTVWGLVDPTNIPGAEQEMKRSLVNHDGYDSGIVVKRGKDAARSGREPKHESYIKLMDLVREFLTTEEIEELEELSATGGVAGFNTPYAFQGSSETGKKKHKDNAEQAGFEVADTDRSDEKSSMHEQVSRKKSQPRKLRN